jgi:type I restriction enzyme M protein
MDYWTETLQDDAYIIAAEGWQAAKVIRQLVPVKDKNDKTVYTEPHDFVVAKGRAKVRYKADIIPPALIVARYFVDERDAIDQLLASAAAFEQQMEEMREEQGGDEGLLSEVIENDKITDKAVKDRLKAIKGDANLADEQAALQAYAELAKQADATAKHAKEAQAALDAQVIAKYGKLTDAEVKTLVVEDKWLAALAASVQGELDRVSQALTSRIRQLAERYAAPLPQLETEVTTLTTRVEEHLKKMGFSW